MVKLGFDIRIFKAHSTGPCYFRNGNRIRIEGARIARDAELYILFRGGITTASVLHQFDINIPLYSLINLQFLIAKLSSFKMVAFAETLILSLFASVIVAAPGMLVARAPAVR
jgi:hypothetical protein